MCCRTLAKPSSRKSQQMQRSVQERKARKAAAYSRSPRGRYKAHRHNAARRGIEFALSFAQWWAIWKRSGRWNERGRGRGRFVMARNADRGGYEEGNVYITTNEVNAAAHEYDDAARARMARARRDRPRNSRGQYVTAVARKAAQRQEVQQCPAD
jgi:hypothetical protein